MKKIPISFVLYQDDSSTFQKFLPKRLYLNGNTTLFEKKKDTKVRMTNPPRGTPYNDLNGEIPPEWVEVYENCSDFIKWSTRMFNLWEVGNLSHKTSESAHRRKPHLLKTTLQSKWFKSGSTRIRATNMRFAWTGPKFRTNCKFIHVYMRYDLTSLFWDCRWSMFFVQFPIDGPFHGFLNFWHGQGRENPSTPLERAPQC